MEKSGDLLLKQSVFINSILEKYGYLTTKSNSSIQSENLPDDPDIPTIPQLRILQGYSGDFNWLATRTRPDLSYSTSLIASASSKYNLWSLELARNVLKYLAGTRDQGLRITCKGNLLELSIYSCRLRRQGHPFSNGHCHRLRRNDHRMEKF